MDDSHRVKIQNSNILTCLIEHVTANREMSATQVTAGIALLKKVMPDLQITQLTGDADQPIETRTRVEHCIVDAAADRVADNPDARPPEARATH